MSLSPLDLLYHAIKSATLRAQDFDGLVDPNCYVEIHSLQNPNVRFFATPLHFAFHYFAVYSEANLNNLVATVGELCKLGALAHIPILAQTDENVHQIEAHGIWPSEDNISDHSWHRFVSQSSILHSHFFCPLQCFPALVKVPGIDLEQVDRFNRTPLEVLFESSFDPMDIPPTVDFVTQQAILELLRAGANVNRKKEYVRISPEKSRTPLAMSVELDFEAGTRLIVQRATPDILEDALHTPTPNAHHKSIVAAELAERECQRLKDVCFGLISLNLPVLCVLCVFEAGTIVDNEWKETVLPSAGKQWTVAKKIKRAATLC